MIEPKSASEADFRSILEATLKARSEDQEPANLGPGGYPVADPDIHEAIEQLLSSPAYVPVGRLAQMYAEEQSSRRLEKARNLDQFLADELSLSPDLTAEELKRLRREFAIYNHPDRVASADRDRATRRMTLVNVLIDKALKERKDGAEPDA